MGSNTSRSNPTAPGESDYAAVRRLISEQRRISLILSTHTQGDVVLWIVEGQHQINIIEPFLRGELNRLRASFKTARQRSVWRPIAFIPKVLLAASTA